MTINQAVGQPDPTSTSPISFTVVFSETVFRFAPRVVDHGRPRAAPKTATVTGGGTIYSVSVTGMTTSGTVIATIAAAGATDLAGRQPNVGVDLDRQHRDLGHQPRRA